MKTPRILNSVIASIILGLTITSNAAAQGIKQISNPGGGEIVYGDIEGRGTGPEAMINMLKLVHVHFE